jgi:hypothetical protein
MILNIRRMGQGKGTILFFSSYWSLQYLWRRPGSWYLIFLTGLCVLKEKEFDQALMAHTCILATPEAESRRNKIGSQL